MGTVYHRLEKHELAEFHFRRALSINERSRRGPLPRLAAPGPRPGCAASAAAQQPQSGA